jgi:hypothetical protein
LEVENEKGYFKIFIDRIRDASNCAFIDSLKAGIAPVPPNASLPERAKLAREYAELERSIDAIGGKNPYSSFGFYAALKWDECLLCHDQLYRLGKS